MKETHKFLNNNCTPISATPKNPNLQPTVLIKKLPTPLRKQKFDVDADSTTNLDLTFSNISEVETIADVAETKKPGSTPVQKKAKKLNIKVMNLMEDTSNADQEKYSKLFTRTIGTTR